MQAIRACVAATVRRDLEESTISVGSHEERVTFRWRRFLLNTHFVVTVSAVWFCMIEDEIPQPETLADSDTSDHRSFGSVQTTTNGIEQRKFRENANLEWMTCLSCGDRWSRQTPLCPGCASTTRLQQMTNKTEIFFGCRFLLCKRVIYTSLTTESRVSPFAHSCSAAQPMVEQVMVMDSDSVGSEESFTMLNVPTESAVTPQEQQFLLEQQRHLSSCGITGQEARRAIVRTFPDN